MEDLLGEPAVPVQEQDWADEWLGELLDCGRSSSSAAEKATCPAEHVEPDVPVQEQDDWANEWLGELLDWRTGANERRRQAHETAERKAVEKRKAAELEEERREDRYRFFADLRKARKAKAIEEEAIAEAKHQRRHGISSGTGLLPADQITPSRDIPADGRIKWRLAPSGVLAGAALEHCVKVISELTKKGQQFKIGLTIDPNHRFYDAAYAYVREGYTFMCVLYRTENAQACGLMEASLIATFRGASDNKARGGESIKPGCKYYFVYVVVLES